jgi:hypothetical protein
MSRRLTLIMVSTLAIIFFLGNLLFNANYNTRAESFNVNIRVDDTELIISNQLGPSIAVDNLGTIHVVWEDWRNDQDGRDFSDGGVDGVNNADIYYAKSIDGGLTFNANIKVNTNMDLSLQELPSVAVDSNGKIHVVWADWRNDADGRFVSGGGIDGFNNKDVYYANSTDEGLTWSTGKRINDDLGSTGQGPGFRSIAVDGNNNIHIIWIDRRLTLSGDIYYANSTDGGITFSKNKKVNDVSIASSDPAINTDESNVVYVAWVDDRNDTTKSDIFFSKSTDGGISFSLNKKINDDDLPLTYQGNPTIAAHGGFVAIAWSDHRNQNCIYFANSTDSGDTFSTNTRIDNDILGKSKSTPSLTMNNGGDIFIAWRDKRNDNEDIYFANSTNGGSIFSSNQRINDDTGTSYQRFPSIAVRNNTVYVVWQDDRNGNWDIYFSRSNFPPPSAIPISPSNGSALTEDEPTLFVTSVSDPDDDKIFYNFTISDQPDAESGTSYSSGWIDATSWTTSSLTDGKWYWHTYTSDMWNTTTPNWVWNFTIDTTSPVISNLEPPDLSWTNEKKPTIGAAYSDSSGINVSSVMFEIDGSDMTSSAIVTLSGFTYIPQSELSSGLHTIYLEVEDNLGNLGIASWSFTIDDRPVVEVREPGGVQYQEYVQGDVVSISWAATDDNPLPSNPINITYGNTTAGWTTISLNEANDGAYAWDTSTIPCPGSYWLNMSVYDSFGQTVFDESNYSFNITCPDTTPPVISNLRPVNGSLMSDSNPTIGANFSDASGINVSSIILKVDGEVITSWALVLSDGIEYVPALALSDGSHTVYLEVTDIHGNMANAAWTFEVDTQPDDFLSEYWWVLVVIAVVVAFLIILFFVWRRRRKRPGDDITKDTGDENENSENDETE